MKRNASFAVIIAIGVLWTVVNPRQVLAGEGDGIPGAWVVSITGGPGTPPLPNWYRALATFTDDGGLIQTITDPSIGTGHGRWSKLHGGRGFAVTTLLFRFDASGDFQGTLKARGTLTLDRTGNQFTSDPYVFEFFDRDGNFVGTGRGVAVGKRITVEPLP
jgi:hypothetical protein